MKFTLVSCAIALFAVSGSAQWLPSLPSAIYGGYQQLQQYAQMVTAITQIRQELAKTPLGPLLPSTTQMISSAMEMAKSAKNINEAMTKAQQSINKMVEDAAKQANISPASVNQMMQQIQQGFKPGQAVGTAGSAINNFIQAAPPPPPRTL